jgi:hypothetical protein
MPIIAGRASAAYGGGFAAITATPFTLLGNYYALGSVAGDGSATVLQFTNIPNDYSHLQLRVVAQNSDTSTGGNNTTTIRANGDTGSNYAYHSVSNIGAANTSSLIAKGAVSQSSFNWWYTGAAWQNASGSGANANVSIFLIDIFDYASNAKNKPFRNRFSFQFNSQASTNGGVLLGAGVWLNTAPITSLSFTAATGAFTSKSLISLYGVK